MAAGAVSVPEKTLEHWCSQYVNYLYRSHAALWWPANGQDIDIRWMPARPGKALQLELKTATVVSANAHEVRVDLRQLWDYATRPLGLQPFYVLPLPVWRGELQTAATTGGAHATEFAFSRSRRWWFTNWMVVLTTGEVARILRRELSAHGGRPPRPTKTTLVRVDLGPAGSTRGTSITWGRRGLAARGVVPLRDFWNEINRCGRAGWPQLVRLPQGHIAGGTRRLQRERVLTLLREAATWEGDGELATLEPAGQGEGYRISSGLSGDFNPPEGEIQEANEVGVEERRTCVFLEAEAFFPA